MCGMKPEDFILSQKMGCPFCYLFMEDTIVKVIGAVQDDSYKHYGKKSDSNILHKFLKKIINDEAKKNPENSSQCKHLKKLIRDYFWIN